jgi:Leucine-rich repeat (LRR) protein
VLIANNTQLGSLEGVGFNQLLKLKELNLSGNKELDDLMPLLNCANLEFLTINRTRIKKIPDEIENLKKLKKLSISSGLIAISDSIGKLDDMRYLSFGGNRSLTQLPNSITKMEKLLHLDISNTKIEQLPEGVADLPLENVLIYNTNCKITKDYKALKSRLGAKFKE